MSDDQQETAEAIDPDELGDDATGELRFPPDRPVGVDDPTQDDHTLDSVRGRAWREVPETGGPLDDVDDDDTGLRLRSTTDVLLDDEGEAVAIMDGAGDLSAEEAAVHLVD